MLGGLEEPFQRGLYGLVKGVGGLKRCRVRGCRWEKKKRVDGMCQNSLKIV